MDHSSWFPALATLLVQIVTGAFVYGRLSQTTGEHGSRLDKHDARLDRSDERISGHDVEIGELRAWRAGYDAGSARQGMGHD